MYSLAYAMLQALYLSSIGKSYGESPQKVREGDKILTVISVLCEPSFQVAQLCNVSPTDIQRFQMVPMQYLKLCTDIVWRRPEA